MIRRIGNEHMPKRVGRQMTGCAKLRLASGGAVVRLDAISSLAQTLARLASVDQSAIDPAGRQTWLIGLLVAAFVAACSIDWALRARRGLP